jgi:hypothetical protein
MLKVLRGGDVMDVMGHFLLLEILEGEEMIHCMLQVLEKVVRSGDGSKIWRKR